MFIKILMTSAAWGCWGWAGLGLDGNYWTGLLEDPLPVHVVVIREGKGLEPGFEIFDYIYGWVDTIYFRDDSVL